MWRTQGCFPGAWPGSTLADTFHPAPFHPAPRHHRHRPLGRTGNRTGTPPARRRRPPRHGAPSPRPGSARRPARAGGEDPHSRLEGHPLLGRRPHPGPRQPVGRAALTGPACAHARTTEAPAPAPWPLPTRAGRPRHRGDRPRHRRVGDTRDGAPVVRHTAPSSSGRRARRAGTTAWSQRGPVSAETPYAADAHRSRPGGWTDSRTGQGPWVPRTITGTQAEGAMVRPTPPPWPASPWRWRN